MGIDYMASTWPDKWLRWAWSFNTISSATLLNVSSSEMEETESDMYSSNMGTSDSNMSLMSEMYFEAPK